MHDVSFTLKRGAFVVVTGRIGSGKTTLARVLLGLLPRDDGQVLWNGAEVTDLGDFMTPPRVAYTSQVPRLFSESLRDNLLLGMPEEHVDLQRAMRFAVMDADLPGLEKGLDTLVGPKGVRLSGGQIQRSAAARMFAREPELLVVDDLSSALDVETERTLVGTAGGHARCHRVRGEPPARGVVARRSHHRVERGSRSKRRARSSRCCRPAKSSARSGMKMSRLTPLRMMTMCSR